MKSLIENSDFLNFLGLLITVIFSVYTFYSVLKNLWKENAMTISFFLYSIF